MRICVSVVVIFDESRRDSSRGPTSATKSPMIAKTISISRSVKPAVFEGRRTAAIGARRKATSMFAPIETMAPAKWNPDLSVRKRKIIASTAWIHVSGLSTSSSITYLRMLGDYVCITIFNLNSVNSAFVKSGQDDPKPIESRLRGLRLDDERHLPSR